MTRDQQYDNCGKCDNCGKPARRLVPVLNREPANTDILTNGPLSRAAIATLCGPGIEARIPWGQHPDDDQYAAWCEPCAHQVMPNISNPHTRGENA